MLAFLFSFHLNAANTDCQPKPFRGCNDRYQVTQIQTGKKPLIFPLVKQTEQEK
jgi:hypothetical protein